MSRSPVSNLGELWRRDPLLTIPGMQRPRSPKTAEGRFTFAGPRNEDWNLVKSATTGLFQRKTLASNIKLISLSEKVKNVKADYGTRAVSHEFKESILKKGMIILREDMKEKSGALLLDKLANAWKHLYTTVLPLLQAIFVHVGPSDGQTIRDLTLTSFRDIVVLKTKLEDTFLMDVTVPPLIVQMLLVLQSTHDTPIPNAGYKELEHLLSYVVSPYVSSEGLISTRPKKKSPRPNQKKDSRHSDSTKKTRPMSDVSTLPPRSAQKLERRMQESMERRHTIDSVQESVDSGVGASVSSVADSEKITKSTSVSDM